MGICASEYMGGPDEKRRNEKVDQDLKEHEEREENVLKLLLLGAGGSGKSTLFKQMIEIYGSGFSKRELESYTPLVHSNVIRSIQELIKQSQIYAEKKGVDFAVDKKLKDICEDLDDLNHMDENKLTEEQAKQIASLWADPGIQATFEMRHEFQLPDSAKFFFDKVEAIGKPGYLATVEDYLRVRTPTTGVTEKEFLIEDNKFRLVDVGGQRSERKKWIHCFSEVQCVLFVCAISSFNQVWRWNSVKARKRNVRWCRFFMKTLQPTGL